MLWRLPEHLVIDVLILSHELGAYDELDVRPTRSLGRLASLARFLARPARIASLHTVEMSEALAEQLRADAMIVGHFRTIILRTPESLLDHAGRWALPAQGGAWMVRILRWRQAAAVVLLGRARSARHLVVQGPVALLSRELVQTVAKRSWDAVTLALATQSYLDEDPSLLAALLDAIAPATQTLTLSGLHIDPALLPDGVPERAWPRLQRLVARKTESATLNAIIRCAPSINTLEVLGIDGVVGTVPRLVLSVPRPYDDRGRRAAGPFEAACEATQARQDVEVLELVLRDERDFGLRDDLDHGLIDAPPPGLPTLRISVKCGADLDATIATLLVALQPGRWTDRRKPRKLELVWTRHRSRADQVHDPALRIQDSIELLRERCATRGVDFELFIELGGSCRCGAALI